MMERLRDHDDEVGASLRAAEPLPRVAAASRALVQRRIAETLRRSRRRGLAWLLLHPRLWRPALAVAIVFLSGGLVGAALQQFAAPEPMAQEGSVTATPLPSPTRRAVRRSSPAGARPVEVAPPAPPAASPPPPPRRSRATGARRASPAPFAAVALAAPPAVVAPSQAAPPAGHAPPAAPSSAAPTPEHTLVAAAMRLLYRDGDAAGALATLDAHAARGFVALGAEALATRTDALVALGRKREALALLETISPDQLPRSRERRALRGELRAAAGRFEAARADFESVLAGGARDQAFERALYGHALCLEKAGEHERARAELERYLAAFPSGRFAAGAARALGGGAR